MESSMSEAVLPVSSASQGSQELTQEAVEKEFLPYMTYKTLFKQMLKKPEKTDDDDSDIFNGGNAVLNGVIADRLAQTVSGFSPEKYKGFGS
jgi:hypothetical protein